MLKLVLVLAAVHTMLTHKSARTRKEHVKRFTTTFKKSTESRFIDMTVADSLGSCCSLSRGGKYQAANAVQRSTCVLRHRDSTQLK